MSKKILFVDDDVFLSEMYRAKFEEMSYVVTPALAPEIALSLLEKNSYDAMITDMVMPGMSGLALVERAKVLAPDLPIIFLTNQSEGSDIEAAKALGVLGYLVKADMVPSEVVHKVDTLLTKRKKK
jgi:CheY-like chemotaxis protein